MDADDRTHKLLEEIRDTRREERLVTHQARWLTWAQKLQAIARAGLSYSKDPCDLDRFGQVRAIASNLPQLDTHRVTLAQVERLFKHHEDSSLPTDFD